MDLEGHNLYFMYLVIGFISGTTNAMMELGIEKKKKGQAEKSALEETGSTFSNMKFLVPFLIN